MATLPNPQPATSDRRTPSSMRRSDEAGVVFPLLFLLYNIRETACILESSLSTLKLIWCVIYLASESTQLVTLISRDEKNNASAVWGPLRLGGPGPGPAGPIG